MYIPISLYMYSGIYLFTYLRMQIYRYVYMYYQNAILFSVKAIYSCSFLKVKK